MSFFDEISRKVEKTGKETVQKGRELSETRRLNSQISEAERMIKDCCREIGELYLSLHREDHEEAFSGLIEKVQALENQITACKERIEVLKNTESCRCQRCGAPLPKGARFCGNCGAMVPEKPPKAVGKINGVCPHCGCELEEGAVFCVECGSKVQGI